MESAERPERDGWNTPRPTHIPGPTFWPAGLALGIALFAIGPAFEYVVGWVSASVGATLVFFSLRGWILEIRNDTGGDDE